MPVSYWFIVDHTDHIMELVNEWPPTGKFRKVDTHFWKDSAYKKELLSELPLTGHVIHKAEMEYHGNVYIQLELYNTLLV